MEYVNVVNSSKVTNMRRGIGISAILYLIYASYYISGYSSQLHNYVLIALFAVWTFMAIAEDINSFNKAFNNKTVVWVILFLFYYFFTSIVYGDIINTMEYIAKYILLFACVFQFKYYKARNNPRELKFIVICTLMVWAFFAIKAIAFYIAVPSAARTLASDFYAFDNIAIGGGYAIAFGSAILCVYLFERFINRNIAKRSLKFVFFAFVIILFYLLIKTESTLTLISCAVGMVLSIIRKMWRNDGARNDLNKLITTILLVSVSLVVLLNIQEIGEWIIEITKDGIDNTIVRRFNRVGQKMAYSGTGSTYENYVDERFGYVAQSWNTFLKNPIIGVGFKSGNIFSNLENNGLGMHSAICDLLAQHGILGSVPFIMFFIKGLKKECWVYNNTYIVTMLFMVVVNPFEYFHAYIAMFTLIPMIDILIDRSNIATRE
jgi:hypothetical protein